MKKCLQIEGKAEKEVRKQQAGRQLFHSLRSPRKAVVAVKN